MTEGLGIAGTGAMAKALGALLRGSGIPVAAIAGRRQQAAAEAALFTGAAEATAIRELPRYSRRILIAVSDDAVAQVACELADGGLENAVVLHTCGALGPEALAPLRPKGNAVGVLHPLQTVPAAERGVETLPGATFAYAGDGRATEWARTLIGRLGGEGLAVNAQHWHDYHAAAVMASNYHVTLIDAALELMEGAGIGRAAALHALAPIVRTTADNVLMSGPEAALTGPIRRGDAGTVRRHATAMRHASPATAQLYSAAGLRTIEVAARAGLGAEAAREIARALQGS